MFFGPNQNPSSVLACILSGEGIGSIMVPQSSGQVLSLTDVESTAGVLKYISPEHKAIRLAPQGGIPTSLTFFMSSC